MAFRSNIPYFCFKTKCYRLGRFPLKGVRPLLCEWYWPQEEEQKGANCGGGTLFGLSTGRRVDREISDWARNYQSFLHDPSRVFTLHKYTQKLISAFEVWEWTPLKGQYVVGARNWGNAGTAIDLIMETADHKVIIVEVKCGYDGYWQKPSGKLAAPLSHIDNTPLIQATAQLLFGYFLLVKTTQHRPSLSYVVNVNKDEVMRYKPPADVAQAILIDIEARCKQRNTDRSTRLQADIQKKKETKEKKALGSKTQKRQAGKVVSRVKATTPKRAKGGKGRKR